MSFVQRHTDLRIQTERVWLDALLSHAPDVRGLILCAAPHLGALRDGREDYAAQALREAGFATLLVNMLTPYEETRDPDLRFDVSLLNHRLQALFAWIDQQPMLTGLPRGLIAGGTLAAAAIRLLAQDGERAAALVSRAGRADLAGAEPLRRLRTPLLMLIPAGEGELNNPARQAYQLAGGLKHWQEIAGASGNFSEPGALEATAIAARDWFLQHLPPPGQPATS